MLSRVHDRLTEKEGASRGSLVTGALALLGGRTGVGVGRLSCLDYIAVCEPGKAAREVRDPSKGGVRPQWWRLEVMSMALRFDSGLSGWPSALS